MVNFKSTKNYLKIIFFTKQMASWKIMFRYIGLSYGKRIGSFTFPSAIAMNSIE